MISKNVCIRLGQNFKRLRGLNQCPQVRSAHEVAELFTELCDLDREVMAAAVLDCKCRMICWELVAVGSANQVMLRQGDVFHAAIANRGSGLIVVHNHPSGDPTPSRYILGDLQRRLFRTQGNPHFHLTPFLRTRTAIRTSIPRCWRLAEG